jgi:hypothetical protein
MSNFVEFENQAPWSPGAKKPLSSMPGYKANTYFEINFDL